jgi:PadR family transcriptional regulator, regulatory protein PadR
VRNRNRTRLPDGTWDVRARVERLGEPALLLLLSDGPTHGYELLERLPSLLGEERVDVGNVYRALRGLEEEGLVTSEWRADLPGPAKRTYTLTDEGASVLDSWVASLEKLRDDVTVLVDRAREKGGDRVRTA